MPQMTIDQQQTNLPAPIAPLIGRRAEIAEMELLLVQPDPRMITVLAPGGMGKTMFALEVARRQLAHFADGVYVITLSEPINAEQLATLIAQTMSCQYDMSMSVQEQILAFLQPRELLLLLDNAEYGLEAIPFLNDILIHAPATKILATSQVKLNLYAERVFPLGGLAYTNGSQTNSAENEAVDLFIYRSKNVSPQTEFSEQSRIAIRQICRMTQGTPLAIVLAASWTALLTPEEIVRELERGFDFLETDLQDLPQRQRSLRAIFDYMWRLMPEDEQRFLARIAVFRGGLTREAAQTVTGGNLHNLMSLLKRAVLHNASRAGRFEMHEILRQFAEKRLQGSGEFDAVLAAYGRYFLDFARQQTDDIKGRRQVEALDAMDADADNLWAAWKWAVEYQDYTRLGDALDGIFWYCMMRSRYPLFESIHKTVVDNRLHSSQLGARVLAARVNLRAYWMRRWCEGSLVRYPQVIEELEELLTDFEAEQLPLDAALCRLLLGDAVRTLSDDVERAQTLVQTALQAFNALGDPYYAAWALHFSAKLISDTRSIDEGIDLLNQALVLRRKQGDQSGVAYSLYNLSTDLLLLGQVEACAQVTDEVLSIGQKIGEQSTLMMAAITKALLALLKGHLDDARSANAINIRAAKNLNHGLGLSWAYITQSLLDLFNGDVANSASFLSLSDGGAAQAPLRYFVHFAYALMPYHDDETVSFHLHSALRHAQTFGAPGAHSLCLPPLARWYARSGQVTLAASVLGLAHAQPPALMGWLPFWLQRTSLDTQVEQSLGNAAYTRAFEQGQQQSVEAIIHAFLAVNVAEKTRSVPFPAHIQEANRKLIEPLSERELEVLRYIGRGLSNREIAAEMIVELSTVKKHLTHIYGKLEVGSRAQAILQAQALKLV